MDMDKRINNLKTDFTSPHQRGISTSTDGGITWSAVTNHPTLTEPPTGAAFIRYTKPPTYGKSRLLFSNTATSDRTNLIVRLSYDEGVTWPVSKTYQSSNTVYSSLTVLTNGDFGVLFENGTPSDYVAKTTFFTDTLSNLTSGADALDLLAIPSPPLTLNVGTAYFRP